MNKNQNEEIFDRNILFGDNKKFNNKLKNRSEKKSWTFISVIIIMLILTISIVYRGISMMINNDYMFKSFLNEDAPAMPSWYPLVTTVLGLIAILGILLIIRFKKIGVYVEIISLFISVVIQPEFMVDGTLYSLFSLFVFIGYGLAIIYPYWHRFK